MLRNRSLGALALVGLAAVLVAGPLGAQELDPEADPNRATASDLLEQRRDAARRRALEEADREREFDQDNQPVELNADAEPNQTPSDEDGVFHFGGLSEAMDLSAFVELVANLLDVQIIERSTVTGTIVINSPRDISEDRLLSFLEAMLDQWDYALTYDEDNDFYVIQGFGELTSSFGGDLAATQVIYTPNVKPSALKSVIDTQNLGRGGQGAASNIAYLDELGIIVITAPPRRVELIRELINQVIDEFTRAQYIRIPVTHISAPAARQRAIELVGRGGATGSGGRIVRSGDGSIALPGGQTGRLDNLAERLTIDTQGNSLIFRGRENEIEQVLRVIAVIDKPNTLIPIKYYAGASASQIADIARQRGLGEVTILSSRQQQTLATQRPIDPTGLNPFGQQQSLGGGSAMIVDPERGNIIYYATPEQHEQMARLIEELDPGSDRVVIRAYKLHHADAFATAELILSLISNQRPTGQGALLPQARTQQTTLDFDPALAQTEGDDGELGAIGAGPDVFVIADEANNQILVKSPLKQQDEFRKLIEKIDLRRPQVYIQVHIVAVADQRDFELTVESQLLNAGGEGGAFQSVFGITSAGGDGDFTSSRVINPSLLGITTAILKSEYVPFVLNALVSTNKARIVSSPQLLVDDNEEARLVSVEQQPTTVTSQVAGAPSTTAFGGFQDAGTTLTVTPRISEGGYLQLSYEVQLSNFVGEGTGGIPANRQERTVGADSVTIPSDRTIIVGGIKVTETGKTVLKVPLLGDIPLLGFLFRSTKETENEVYLYVFITPRIMSDPNFGDLIGLTMGPQAEAELEIGLPKLEPAVMEMMMPMNFASSSPAIREDDEEAGMIRRRRGG